MNMTISKESAHPDGLQPINQSGNVTKVSKITVKNNKDKYSTSNQNRTSRKLNKVVIRHLPPTMTEEQFIDQVSPIPEHNYLSFSKGDQAFGHFLFCRAYINFLHEEDIFLFKQKFDGYVFIDAKGNEFPATVEFSPFQKIPRRRIASNGVPYNAKKRDLKSGTIEQDHDYLKFLESLEESKNETSLPSAEVYLEEIEARNKELKANRGCLKVTTPLIEFLKQRKAEKMRLREERREERKRQQSEIKRIREEEIQKKQKDRFHQQKVKDKKERKDKERKDKTDSGSKKNLEYKSSDKFCVERKRKQNATFTVKVLQNTEKERLSHSKENAMKAESSDVQRQVEPKRDIKKHSDELEDAKQLVDEHGKRVRNKDRPALEIYKPGSTRRNPNKSPPNTGLDNYESSQTETKLERPVRKSKVFSRSKNTH